ncbi:MAG: nitroreductase family protein [Methanosarcinales archaeon]|jgi:nitroreductase|nr:nitroreductase family protein [Methanosarcinales archaeon]
METLDALITRKSVRKYKKEQIKDAELEIILAAGGVAPIGMGDYASIHLTVIQNPEILERISSDVKAAAPGMKVDDPIFGAPTLIIVSSRPNERIPAIGGFNVSCIIQNMMIAATDIGVGSVFMLSTMMAFTDPLLVSKLKIPSGFKPLAAAAFGYSDEPAALKELKNTFETTYLR